MPRRISIIVPCFNESTRITGLLNALLRQDMPLDQLEVIIADGRSTDDTVAKIEAFAGSNPEMEIRVIENRASVIPAALNKAINNSTGDVVIRLDAHSVPRYDYIRRCLEVLESTGAANVGGLWEIEPGGDSWIARSIAAAAAHPLGAGDARYRIGGDAGPVETVPFGAFRREWVERVGPFDEEMLANEDYEYNTRIGEAGGLIWFDPSIRSIYFARSSLGELARQYWRYGYWKARMIRRYPRSIRWRQVLPPLFILVSLALVVTGAWWQPAWVLLAAQWMIYSVVLFTAGLVSLLHGRELARILGLPLAILTMHISWGSAFLVSLFKPTRGVN